MGQKITKDTLFKRQTTLQEIGVSGMEKLQNTNVLIVGCGGLGSVASVYLAASGLGKIHLIDFDVIEASNLHRQVYYTTNDIGKSKAETLSHYIKAIAPFTQITYEHKKLLKDNVLETISAFDIILDCTDDLTIKYLLNDACVLKDKPLIYGSLYKFDGYVATFNFLNDNGRTANLRDAFPTEPNHKVPNCSEIGTMNTIVGMIGLLQANEVIKMVTQTGTLLTDQILIYNSLENSQYSMKVTPRSTKEHIEKIFNEESYTTDACEWQEQHLLITPQELKEKLTNEKPVIISVIENITTELPFSATYKIPLSQLQVNNIEVDHDMEYVIVCNKGVSSYKATLQFKEKYPDLKVLSLKGGISAMK